MLKVKSSFPITFFTEFGGGKNDYSMQICKTLTMPKYCPLSIVFSDLLSIEFKLVLCACKQRGNAAFQIWRQISKEQFKL